MRTTIHLWPAVALVFALAFGAAAPAVADETPAPAAAPPAAAKVRVTLVLSDELRAAKWSEKSWGGKRVNALADAIVSRTTAMLGDMGAEVRTASPTEHPDGTQFYVTPIIKRAEQSLGTFAWSKDHYTLALEWRVTDDKGATVLLDTVVGEGTGTGGNAFTASAQAVKIFNLLMDDTFTKSRALLAPVLTPGAPAPAAPAPAAAP